MKTYHLKSGDDVVASGPMPPEYDADRRAYLIGGLLVSAASPADFTIEVEDVVARRTVMTPIRFEEQFTIDEQLEIEDRRAYVAGTLSDRAADEMAVYQKRVLDLLFGKLKDPRLAEVDVADPSVIAGIDFCQHVGILADTRAATIKLGLPE